MPSAIGLLEAIGRAPEISPLRGPWPGVGRSAMLEHAIAFLRGCETARAGWIAVQRLQRTGS